MGVATGVALAACGTGTSSVTVVSGSVVAGSYATTLAAQTADVAVTTTPNVEVRTLPSFTASGVIDHIHHAWEIHFGNGLQPGDNVIRIGSDVYTEAATAVGRPVVWLRQPARRSPVNKVPSYDPEEALSYLQHISGHVTDVGHDAVRGVPVEHYRATVNLTQSTEATTTTYGVAGTVLTNESAAPLDVWVDHQGRVRRLEVSVQTRTKASEPVCQGCQDVEVGTSSSTADVTVEFFNFGVPVDVQPPPGAVDESNNDPMRPAGP